MQKVLLATDGSEDADRALAIALDLVKALNGNLVIATVSEDNFSAKQLEELSRLGIAEGDALEELSRRIVVRAKELAHKHGITNVKTSILVGDPADMIIDIAQREQVDAIVVGRRGRGRLSGLLLGSVSQKLASLAACVIIIVP